MKFDAFRFHRKSTRYQQWDYRTPGYYFITICTHHRQMLFEDERCHDIATFAWDRIAKIPHVKIDERIIMPNHGHGIIQLTEFPSPQQTEPEPQEKFHHAPAGSIGAIIGGYKTITTKRVNLIKNTQGNKVWQRGYWDRIIRNEGELNAIREYIRLNPERWAQDRDNLDTLLNTRMTHHPA